MRALFAGVVVLAMSSGACALLAGLSDYEGRSGGADGSAPPITTYETGSPSGDDVGSAPLNGDGDPAPDADNVADVSSGDGYFVITGDPADALSPDVNTKCDTTTCAGCCQDGMCVGGQSVATCGKGGVTCTDCTSKGGACSTGGACTTKVADAGPPPSCSVSKCPPCIPVYQSSCCKTDMTCGCHTNFGGNGMCN